MPQHQRTGPAWTARRLGRRVRMEFDARRNPIGTGVASIAAPPADLGERPRTTVDATLRPGPGHRYRTLVWGPGEAHLVRHAPGTRASPRRSATRRSLLYFAQHTDAHICDAQSPGRLELGERFAWVAPGADAGHRPQEHASVHVFDQMVRATNAVSASPVSGAPMAFLIETGDNTDDRLYGELRWFIDTLDGRTVTPNTGGPFYEGVQSSPEFGWVYHPEDPSEDPYGRFGFPCLPGLLNSAIRPVDTAGSEVPWLAVLGNHDTIWQGTLGNRGRFRLGDVGQRLSLSDAKPTSLRSLLATAAAEALDGGPVAARLGNLAARRSMTVTPDPVLRRPLTVGEQVAEFFDTAPEPGPIGHGFTEKNLGDGTAHWVRAHGESFVLIGLDTNNHTSGSEGRIGPRQLGWLSDQLDAATLEDRLVVVFSHHNSLTMTNSTDDDHDPGRAVHGDELVDMLARHRNVVLWVNGHDHANRVTHHPSGDAAGSGLWEVCTASCVDFGQQSRTFEIFDNDDGTLSVVVTVLDHAAPLSVAVRSDGCYPPAEIASISRELASNDARWIDPWDQRGALEDRNVELLLEDPRSDIGRSPS